MASELVKRLIAAHEGSSQAALGSDILYRAAERIDYLEKQQTRELLVKQLREEPSDPGGYARFRRGDKIKVLKDGEEGLYQFVGVDADGVVTYTKDWTGFLTAWDCNVYRA